jgi:hypothetical protein
MDAMAEDLHPFVAALAVKGRLQPIATDAMASNTPTKKD